MLHSHCAFIFLCDNGVLILICSYLIIAMLILFSNSLTCLLYIFILSPLVPIYLKYIYTEITFVA